MVIHKHDGGATAPSTFAIDRKPDLKLLQIPTFDVPYGFEPGTVVTMSGERGPISATVLGWSSHGMVISEDGVKIRIVPTANLGRWSAIHPDYREELEV